MALIRIVNSFPNLTIAKLKKFQTEFGVNLPNDYKSFLLAHNGGQPEPNAFPIDGFNQDFDCINSFYGLSHDVSDDSNVFTAIKDFGGIIPNTVIPIAYTESGDFLILDCDKGGSIWYWDYHKDYDHNLWDIRNLYFVADNIEELLSKLFELTDS